MTLVLMQAGKNVEGKTPSVFLSALLRKPT